MTGVFHRDKQLMLLGAIISLATVRADLAPSPNDILAQVRLQQAQQQLDLEGQLRLEDKVVPFRLTQNGPMVRYIFPTLPEVLQLRLGENSSRLDLVTENSTKKFSAARLNERIAGTGVTYGDLALKFLYWPKAELLGAETIRTRSCWKLRLTTPATDSPYSTVLLWVDKESGAMMRMEAYDGSGRLTKRFEVVSAQKIDGRWFLKQMRVEEMLPGTNKVQSRTYLEIKK